MNQKIEELLQTAYESIAEAQQQLEPGTPAHRRLTEALLKIEDGLEAATGVPGFFWRQRFTEN